MKASVLALTAVSGLFSATSAQLLGLDIGLDVGLDVELDIPGLLASLAPAPADDPRFTNWTAPGPGDVRSPCPGLNALANHGFIHHNGKDLTIPHLLTGLAQGLNMGADFTVLIGAAGLLSAPNPFGGSFDLNHLDQHNFVIEHDGSLSRGDAYFGNNYAFNETIFDSFLANFHGADVTSVSSSSAARWSRIQDSMRTNPTMVYGLREFIFSSGETAIYVQTMSSPTVNAAPLEYVDTLFREERLPYAEGWRVSPEPITLLTLGAYVFEIFQANDDKVVEGATIFKDSYLDLFEVLVGGSEILANLTQGISTELGL